MKVEFSPEQKAEQQHCGTLYYNKTTEGLESEKTNL